MSAFTKVCGNTGGNEITYKPLDGVSTYLENDRFTKPVTTWTPPTGLTLTYKPYSTSTDKSATIFALGSRITQGAPSSARYDPVNSGVWNPSVRSIDLTNTQLQNIYARLKNEGWIKTIQDTTLTGSAGSAVVSISYDLLYSLKFEVCYYLKVYQFLLKDLILVGKSTTLNTNDKTVETRKLVNKLSEIKLRINDLIQVSQFIGDKQLEEMKNLQTGASADLTSITADVTSLNTSLSELTKNDKQSVLRSRQLEFSEEKNAYANQLLGLYGFANLIALGLLFYIYKS